MKVVIPVFLLSAMLIWPALAQNQGGNSQGYHAAPGPIAGAGLPLVAVGYGVYWLIKRRRRQANQD